MEDAVGINVKSDLDLGSPARRRRNAVELEGTQILIIPRHGAFTLQDDNFNTGLIIAIGREGLRLFGRNRCVARNHCGGDVASGHDAQRQRRNIEQEHIAHISPKDAPLNRGTDRNNFVRIDALMRRLTPERFGNIQDLRHTRHATNKHELIDFIRTDAGVFQAILKGLHATRKKRFANLLHLCPRELDVEMLRTRRIGGDKGQIDVVGGRRGERDFRLLCFFLQALQRHRILAEIDAVFLLKSIHEPADNGVVPIIAAEVSVAIGGLDLKNAVADLENRHVKGAAAQIEDRNFFVLLFI